MPFVLTQKAKNDLRLIAIYTFKTHGRAQRDHYIRQMDQSFHAIALTPALGQKIDTIREGYHRLPCGKHSIYYRILPENMVQIVRILHQRMDIKQHFSAGKALYPGL